MAKRYLILGLGKSGLSAATYLRHQNADLVLADTRAEIGNKELLSKNFPNVDMFLGKLPLSILDNINTLVISPGLSPELPLIREARRQGIEIIGDIELFCQQASSPVIAITGTNAKSTVATLIAEMISDAGYSVGLGGNIGTPALELLKEAGGEPDYYVLELSSFQLESTTSLKAKVAVILNITPDHMDRYDSFEHYVETKQRIYISCETALFNRDDKNTHPGNKAQRVISFGTEQSCNNNELSYSLKHTLTGNYLLCENERVISTEALRITGEHNYLNCLAALAICDAIGIQRESQVKSLKKFSGLAHRCETIADIAGVRWINDSKGTNVGASLAALSGFGKTFSKKIILILGGVSKDASFSPLTELINQYVKKVLVYGQDSAKIISDLIKEANVSIEGVGSLEQAVSAARSAAEDKDLVLFSPACASFDMFDNFEHRGDVFRKLVHDFSSPAKSKMEGL